MSQPQTSYSTQIIAKLTEVSKIKNPDERHNEGSLIGQAYLWDTILDYAKKKSDALWKKMEDQAIVKDADERKLLSPGDHELTNTPHFTVTAKVTQPVRTFNPDALADALKRKYKVPVPECKQMIEAAKKPTSPRVTLAIIETGGK